MSYYRSILRGPALRFPMNLLTWFGLRILPLVVLALSILLAFAMLQARLSDFALMAITAAACLITLYWAATGARLLLKWAVVPIFTLGIVPSIMITIAASFRFPPLEPFLIAVIAVFTFVVVGCAACWFAPHRTNTPLDGIRDAPRLSAVIVAGIVCAGAGLLFFRPLIVLLNGQAETRPPLVFPGKVVGMYETNGKQHIYHIVLAGPAAGYSSTSTDGEFEVPRDYYRSAHVGALRCVTIHTGLLGFRWWSLDGCQAADRSFGTEFGEEIRQIRGHNTK